MLQRGYTATTRLNCQFYLWKLELGFSLHPAIPEPHPGARIADVATGTGIWLLDVARELPGRLLDGFDISLIQTPPSAWLPKEITMRAWDMYTDVPTEMIGIYDIVHLRLLLLAVRNNDPAPIIANAAKMLKPNGFIQWDELNPVDAYVTTTHEDLNVNSFRAAQELADFSTLEWVKNLPTILNNSGFCDTVAHHYKCEPSLAKFYQDMQCMVMEEEVERRFATAAEKERMRRQIDAVYADSSRGMARNTPKIVYVARKRPGNLN